MSQEHALEHEEWVEGEYDGVRVREVRLIPADRGEEGGREGGEGGLGVRLRPGPAYTQRKKRTRILRCSC